MTNEINREDVYALLKDVTPAPWGAALERGCHGVIAHSLPSGGANFVAIVGNDAETPEKECARFANAKFIAAARELVPALLAENERLRAEQCADSIEELEDEIERLNKELRERAMSEFSALSQAQEAYEAQVELEAKLAKAVEEAEKYQHAFAAQSRKLQAVLHIDGVRTTLAELEANK